MGGSEDAGAQPPLLDLPVNQLLAQFGSGGHTPGSGCAAALMGLLAAQLTLTVCKISTDGGRSGSANLRHLGSEMQDRFIPRLRELFQLDADLFDEVIDARRSREATEDERERRRHGDRALDLLRQATEVVLDVADLCVELIDDCIVIFDEGSRKVRGDSGAAISAAIAAVTTGIFVTNLNLRSFRSGQWARDTQARALALQDLVTERQAAAFERVASLQVVAVPEDQFSFLEFMSIDGEQGQ